MFLVQIKICFFIWLLKFFTGLLYKSLHCIIWTIVIKNWIVHCPSFVYFCPSFCLWVSFFHKHETCIEHFVTLFSVLIINQRLNYSLGRLLTKLCFLLENVNIITKQENYFLQIQIFSTLSKSIQYLLSTNSVNIIRETIFGKFNYCSIVVKLFIWKTWIVFFSILNWNFRSNSLSTSEIETFHIIIF